MSPSECDIIAQSERVPSVESGSVTRSSDCGPWRLELPTGRRRVLLYASALGIGVTVGAILQFPSDATLVLCSAGALSVMSGFAGLWSG